jgi:outer membrane protein assembly factor BamB
MSFHGVAVEDPIVVGLDQYWHSRRALPRSDTVDSNRRIHLIWSRDVLRENHLSILTWGKSCSPLLAHDLVVVTGGDQREKTLLAYEAATGKPVWQTGRDRAGYCSPQLATLCGQEQILMINGHSVTGHDPHNGEVLWEYAWPDDFAKATRPLVIDTKRVFIAAGYGVGCVMLPASKKANPASELDKWMQHYNIRLLNLAGLGAVVAV